MTELWLFVLIWGVWILMPIVVDGLDTLVRLFVVLIWGRNFHEHKAPDNELPNVTILVPAYNEEQVIDRCLNAIKLQDYPHEKLEVVVINDGSTDFTAERVMNHINGGFNENGNGFHNGNGFGNGADGGAQNGKTNGKNGADGGTNGKNGNGNGNGNGFKVYRLPPGVYSTKDFRNGADGGHKNGNGHQNGNGFNGKLPKGIYSSKDFGNGNGKSANGDYKNGTNGGTNGGHKNGTNGGTNGGHKNGNGFNGNGNGYLKINGDTYPVPPFNGDITLVSNGHVGKPKALNLGIKHMNHSDIVITIDSDVVLAPHAVRNMACAFAENAELGAATGHIEISADILEERDEYGNLVLDEEGRLVTKRLTWWETLLTKCQFLEYLDAFRLGRQFQATVHSTYILAGAFSAFRRDILESSPLYRSRTVSEDFDLTADIHRTGARVGYVADAKALLEPVTAWDQLFSQRVRWCRGQLEVCGAHQEMIGNPKYGPIGWFGFPQMLVVDHTLAFPRLIWTLLLLLFPLFGYPMGTIAMAVAFMYLFYVGLSFLQTFSAYTIVDEDTKRVAEKALACCFVLPIYRLVTFYFRMSGYLRTLREPAEWEVSGPLNGVKNGFAYGANGLAADATGGSPTISQMVASAFGLAGRRLYQRYATNGGAKTTRGRVVKWVFSFEPLNAVLHAPVPEPVRTEKQERSPADLHLSQAWVRTARAARALRKRELLSPHTWKMWVDALRHEAATLAETLRSRSIKQLEAAILNAKTAQERLADVCRLATQRLYQRYATNGGAKTVRGRVIARLYNRLGMIRTTRSSVPKRKPRKS